MNGLGQLGRLHVITDVELQTRFSHAELGRIAAAPGAHCVQYRDKRPLAPAGHLRQITELRAARDGPPLTGDSQVPTAPPPGAWGAPLPSGGRSGVEEGVEAVAYVVGGDQQVLEVGLGVLSA